ncbi:MAG: MFS transporter [Planctomycetaceae bacterium]|nr:MFS transporter [Planctomycetaceae bacterium]
MSAALPPSDRRSFWALNITQFLGAFNDNLFKQLVLLLCVERVRKAGGADLQSTASILFAIPFVLLSGLAGVFSDRYSKRTVILACKSAEVVIVLLGAAALATGQIWAPLGVLSLFGIHSAFFGPAKYGILPELMRPADLPRANGSVLMLTFLAIIFGLATAGVVVQYGPSLWGDRLWPVCLPCLIISLGGLATASAIRPLPAAAPQLPLRLTGLFMTRETALLLWTRRDLAGCIAASSLFWFAAGVVYPPAINSTAKLQLGLNDVQTGLMAASTGCGIALGCVLAGRLCRDCVRGWLVTAGGWGLVFCLGLLAMPGPMTGKTLLGSMGSTAALIGVGLSAGLFSVPLQVYLQTEAPANQKGRIVAALNLLNWIGIALSGVFYAVCHAIIQARKLPPATTFGFAAVAFLVLVVIYRPPNTQPAVIEPPQ